MTPIELESMTPDLTSTMVLGMAPGMAGATETGMVPGLVLAGDMDPVMDMEMVTAGVLPVVMDLVAGKVPVADLDARMATAPDLVTVPVMDCVAVEVPMKIIRPTRDDTERTGYGYGYCNGYGDGYGSGNGSGYGYGIGHGSGDGDGNGYGYGYGVGCGYGCGSGYGCGWGDENGCGDGDTP